VVALVEFDLAPNPLATDLVEAQAGHPHELTRRLEVLAFHFEAPFGKSSGYRRSRTPKSWADGIEPFTHECQG
jgi:hypothetical protein